LVTTKGRPREAAPWCLCRRPADPTLRFCDFTRWKEHDAYMKALERLLRDLRVEKA
jgi:hypothetical protein